MAEEIRDLIEKIQQEGIQAAEERARQIEAEARQKAEAILLQAGREAEELTAAANTRLRLEEEKGKALLAQAGRDLLLSLRAEINAMLGRLVATEVGQALSPEMVSGLLRDVIQGYAGEGADSVTVEVNPTTMEALERHFIHRLQEETKKTILLRSSGEITGGFTLSFDHGKSSL
jgi:hypothetical protein